MDKFVEYIESHSLPEIKTLAGIVSFTIKLSKRFYKKRCNREMIKDSIALVMDQYIKRKMLPTRVEELVNTISEEEMFELIDDLYETKDCLLNLKRLMCKSKPLTSDPQKVTIV